MKCRKARKLIFDFVDGALSDSERIQLESHLAECSGCEKLASTLPKSLDLLHHLSLVEPSDNFNWKVRLLLARERNALQEKIASQASWIRRWNLRFALGTAMTFIAVIAGGLILLNLQSTSPGISRYDKKQAQEEYASARKSSFVDRSLFERRMPASTSSGRVGEQFISQGLPEAFAGYGAYRPIEGSSDLPILDPDSLVISKLRSMRLQYRMRHLEQQIDLLQKYLRQCQLENR